MYLCRWLTGPFYGIMIATLGLLGDLTVSLFKRDAGVKVHTHRMCSLTIECVLLL